MSTKREESMKNPQQKVTPLQVDGVITAETKIKDFVPGQLLEDIRSLEAIRGRLYEYRATKEADPEMWGTFSADATKAAEMITNAISDMSSLIGRELDYRILNHTTA